jgi:hypothetical protein
MANKAILVQGGDGTAVPSNMVGAQLSVVQTGNNIQGPGSAGAYVDITSTVTVTPGVYIAMYFVTLSGKAATSDVILTASIRDSGNSVVGNSTTSGKVQNADTATLFAFVPVAVTENTLYKLSATSNTAYSTDPIWVDSLTSSYADEQRARLMFLRVA